MPEPLTLREKIGVTEMDADSATVSSLEQAMASGVVTAATIAAFHLARVERLDPLLRAVLGVSADAVAEAAASDRARSSGARPRPLEGIPVLVKDNIATRGQSATAGSPALAGADPAGDAFCVRKLREAGAVILGRANLSEWANFRSSHPTSGWSTLGGQVANPHALDRNPSGSSSGSAAAVAAGLAPLAVGTETDGSVVCPASVCGIVGLKPTLGLVSRAGIVPISAAQDTAGPMARTVADAAALLGALAGPDPADPVTEAAAGQPRDYTAFLDPGALAGARLGVWRDASASAGPAVAAVLDAAAAALRGAGAELIDPVRLPGADRIAEPELAALLHEFKRDLGGYLRGLSGRRPATLAGLIEFNRRHEREVLARFGQELFERAEATSGGAGDAARREAGRLAQEALDAPLGERRLDAVVALTANPAWLTDYVLGDHVVVHSATPAAVAGYPAISVPAGGVCGLPVGLSFIGPPWSEPRLIALAHAFEQTAPRRLRPRLRPAADARGADTGPQR